MLFFLVGVGDPCISSSRNFWFCSRLPPAAVPSMLLPSRKSLSARPLARTCLALPLAVLLCLAEFHDAALVDHILHIVIARNDDVLRPAWSYLLAALAIELSYHVVCRPHMKVPGGASRP